MGLSQSKISSHDKSILQLKIQRDKLKAYQKQLLIIQSKQVEIAQHFISINNIPRAKLALKLKKHHQILIENTDLQLLNLLELTSQLENAVLNKKILEGIEQGTKSLQEIHKELNIDKINQLMDDTKEAMEYQQEIEDLLKGDVDMESVERELEFLTKNSLKDKEIELPNVPFGVIDLPDVPNSVLDIKDKAMEKQMELA